MFYKILDEKNKVVDVLDNISWIYYQEKHALLIKCNVKIAEAILASDGKKGWHIEGLYRFPLNPNTYKVAEISKYEFDTLKKEL